MKKNYYLIGIKGVGMAALAVYLRQAGHEVTGSDNGHYPTDEILNLTGIKSYDNFDEKNIKGEKPDLVVVSAAYGFDNIEVKTAKKKHLNMVYYSEALGQITSDKKVIAVAGIHGKTTTTALISFMMEKADLSPSFIIGAVEVPDLKMNAHFGEGEYFVLEADEYRKSPENKESKFLDLNPEIAIISSIELDHPDIFHSIEDMYNTFYRFACRIPRSGSIVLCLDYPKAKKLQNSLVDRNFETYGFEKGAKWEIVDFDENDKTTFSLNCAGEKYGPFEIKIPGRHNVLNATAAIIVGIKIGIDIELIKKYIKQFNGVQRRFEKLLEQKEITIIDDYAHHPTAVAKTLQTVREKYPASQIWCIFQPHTFSRTGALLKEFGQAFKDADRIIITETFASAREEDGKITSEDLVNEIKKNHTSVRLVNNFDEIKKLLNEKVTQPAVIITMGAGDIYTLSKDLAKIFKIN